MLMESQRLKYLCKKMPTNITGFISTLVSFLSIRVHIQSRTPSVQACIRNRITTQLKSTCSVQSKQRSFASILSFLSHIEFGDNAAVSLR